MQTSIRTLFLSILALAAVASAAPVAIRIAFANHLECSNGIDDDNDGRTDFPGDPDCTSSDDDSEAPGGGASTSSVSSSSASSSAGLTISISDGKSTVRTGDSLIYVITLTQSTQASRTVDVELDLPPQVNTITPEQGGTVDGRHVRWNRLTLVQGQQQRLTVLINLKPGLSDGTQLLARVMVDGLEATDTTIIQNSPRQGAVFQAAVSDGTQTAAPGERLSYTVTVQNATDQRQTADVILTVSQFVDVSDISPEAPIDANLIVWRDMTFDPNETKTFTFRGIVRRSSPEFAMASTQVRVGEANAVDATSIQSGARAVGSSSSFSASAGAASSAASSSGGRVGNVLFTKTPSTQEAIPGATIRYTLFVQNVLVQPITDAVVNDRFDPALLEVVDAGGATVIGPGQLQWRVPRLEPGQGWEQSYTLRVAQDASNGAMLTTIASVSGTGVAYATLEDKVLVVKTNVVKALPSTGAAFDILFLLSTLPTAAAATALQRRMRR